MELPAYKRLGDTIRQRINEGVYPLGSQLPTELELVGEFNVSRMTVSKGLSDLINAGLIKRIRGKGTFVCSQKFEAIDSKAEVPVIMCILPGAIYEQSFASNALLQGVCAELKETAFQTGIAFCSSEEEIIAELEKTGSGNCAGCILWPTLSERMERAVLKLQENGFPLLLVDSFFNGYRGDFIGTDNFVGSALAIEHLAGCGHRRIGYLTLAPDRSSLAERLAGAVSALSRHGLLYEPQLTGVIPEASGFSTEKVPAHNSSFIRAYLERMLALPREERPTAIFASHDFIAIEIMKLAEPMKFRIPEDFSLVGFDNIDCSGWLPVPLTTVAHDFDAMGRLAARLMGDRLNRRAEGTPSHGNVAPHYRVQPKLVERKSVKSV